jgi:hypothetical protein
MQVRPSKPINLPYDSTGSLSKGREAFLAELHRRLGVPETRATASANRVAVHGLGGIGKTRAALEYAWRHPGDYAAVLFASAPLAAELRANLADLSGFLGTTVEKVSIDQQLAEVLRWVDKHPGWFLIIDKVDTEEAVAEVQRSLARLRSGRVLIASRISKSSAGVEPLELDVLAASVAFLMERTPHRSHKTDDAARTPAIARELAGLALERAGAYIDKQRLSFAEYLMRWEAKHPEVLRWPRSSPDSVFSSATSARPGE